MGVALDWLTTCQARYQTGAGNKPARRQGAPEARLTPISSSVHPLLSKVGIAGQAGEGLRAGNGRQFRRSGVITLPGPTGPIARLVHAAVAPWHAVREGDTRFHPTRSARAGEPLGEDPTGMEAGAPNAQPVGAAVDGGGGKKNGTL